MCGICGIWNLRGEPVDARRLEIMRDRLAHRGPDDAGSMIVSSREPGERRVFRSATELVGSGGGPCMDLGLGHRRLSIIDPEQGDQPMSRRNGRLWVVYNGEIYNYIELRNELEADGQIFRTRSDTEVILASYQAWGHACVERLNGIFAFGLWDADRRQLLLARDHFGVKPLYYRYVSQQLAFASEIKALLTLPEVPRTLDTDALRLCLTFRHTPSPWTLFRSVRKLEPGHALAVWPGGHRHWSFADPASPIDRGIREQEWMEQLAGALDAAVHRQTVADVPISASLSSGVDSSAMVALLARHAGGPVKCFTVGFEGERNSEIDAARRTAERFGAEFHARSIGEREYADFMRRYQWHLEEPVGNTSAAAYYFVARMARDLGFKVLLTGQGVDELFAGYPRYLGAAYGKWLRPAGLPILRRLLGALLRGSDAGERYRRFLFTIGAADEADRVRRLESILPDSDLQSVLAPAVLAETDGALAESLVRDRLKEAPHGSLLERVLYLDARMGLPDDLLLCEDKMAMAASVEARVPYLDRELVALSERIPAHFKLRGRERKRIFRDTCRRWLPEDTVRRPKRGFDNPFDLWLQRRIGKQLEARIREPNSFAATYLDRGTVARWLDEHVSHQRNRERILFMVASLEAWKDVFLEGREPAPPGQSGPCQVA